MSYFYKLVFLLITLSIFPSVNALETMTRQSLEAEWEGKYILIKKEHSGVSVCLKMEQKTLSIVDGAPSSICENKHIEDVWIRDNGRLCLEYYRYWCKKVRKANEYEFFFGNRSQPIFLVPYKDIAQLEFDDALNLLNDRLLKNINSGSSEEVNKLKYIVNNFKLPKFEFLLADYYHAHKKYNDSYKLALSAAEKGNVGAQSLLGFLYSKGFGVVKDEAESFKWIEKAAKQGDANAQHNLAKNYSEGRNVVVKDIAKAIKWHKEAAKQNVAVSMNDLGFIYENKKDYEKSVFWYRKAAAKELPIAQFNLGISYEYGRGVDKDLNQAFIWYKDSSNNGFPKAHVQLGLMYARGVVIEKDLGKAKILMKKAYDSGDPSASRLAKLNWDVFELGKY